MKDKRAQSLIVVLWILVVLTMLALSLGHRVSIFLRLSKYQRDKLKAYCLAQTGINRTISRIQLLGRYVPEKDKIEGLDISVTDEGAKININSAPRLLIEALLQEFGISNFVELTNNICAWRGDTDPGIIIPDAYYANSGYSNKGKHLINIEELALIKGIGNIDSNAYDGLKNFITVRGSGNVNIMTAGTKILNILILYCQKELELNNRNEESNLGDLLNKIIGARQNEIEFQDFSQFRQALPDQSSGQINILNVLGRVSEVKPSCFRIVSSGKVNKSNSTISCIIIGANNNGRLLNVKTVQWHEN